MSTQVDPKSVFVVVPVFNEHQTIHSVSDELINRQFQVVVVDDGSSSPVQNLLVNKKIFLLRHKVNLGQGAALQTGIEFALKRNAQFIVTFDADGQHNPDDVEKLVAILQQKKCDIVLGSRFLVNNSSIPWSRKIALQLARYINLIFSGLFLTDAHNGLRAMTGACAQKIKLQENRMAHASEILLQIKKHRLSYCEGAVYR
jgi:polyprenyl-phospho-N-acetylgalactosaminyl synthase